MARPRSSRCKRGHNDWYEQGGRRHCRACRGILNRRYYRRDAVDRRAQRRAVYAADPEYQMTMNRARLMRAYALINEAKQSGCVDCGERDLRCLDLDHVRGIKVRPVSRMVAGPIERLIAEIAKCEVRCANCHRKITAERRLARTA